MESSDKKVESASVEPNQIAFENVSPQIIEDLTVALAGMVSVGDEIKSKISQVQAWGDELKKIVSKIKKSDGAPEDEYVELDKSIEHFSTLLNKVLMEITVEVDFFAQYTAEKPPKTLPVIGDGSSVTASELIARKIIVMKKGARNIRKDLSVSFSRYEHGLCSQIKRLKLVSGL
jgi:hypothetical protein